MYQLIGDNDCYRVVGPYGPVGPATSLKLARAYRRSLTTRLITSRLEALCLLCEKQLGDSTGATLQLTQST